MTNNQREAIAWLLSAIAVIGILFLWIVGVVRVVKWAWYL